MLCTFMNKFFSLHPWFNLLVMSDIKKLCFNKFSALLDRLGLIYADMDGKYQQAAGFYGFKCAGCRENCCLTCFYHHTLLEYLYIRKGFSRLSSDIRSDAERKAADVVRLTLEAEKNNKTARVMCPLNLDGLCLIYHFRPMICRLHGIPHELKTPRRDITRSPGCNEFTKLFGEKKYYKFDRTPFYLKMAGLEKEARQAAGITHKIKMTIAEMIVEPQAYEKH